MSIRVPDEMAREFADRNLTPGKILYLSYQFPTETQPHNKYFVIASADDPPLLLKIRSNLTPYAKNNPYIAAFHLPIPKADYEFLDYDSHLNCSEVHYGLSLEEIRSQIINDRSRVTGDVSTRDIAQIVKMVSNSVTISPKHKKLVIKALGA